ncbi:ABC transporter permease [Hominiventricola filiformis]|uniref:ABC transporter permease n=1 Tax=Hominiventricola filiformis TaxID=2885352 RepID=A0AAE3AA21_9FIRM|nr:ABC transporter permease [Hominiventricola filiformis]MCC2127212.1 ABC transporter permease [Hominiventricola filiformis]
MNKEKTAKTINMGDLYSSYGMFIIFAIIFFAASVTTDAFLSVNNILNVLRLMCITGISAYGMTFVLTLGEIDLSIGSIMALGGCISAMVWAVTGNPALGFGAGVLTGVICGAISGAITVATSIPTLITTFAMQTIARGIVYLITDGQPVAGMGESFKILGQGTLNSLFNISVPVLGAIPLPIWLMFFLLFICWILLNKTKFGRYVYATGGNREAAKASGIKINSIIFRTYVMNGALAAISGIILMSRMNSGQPSAASGYEFDAISACVLGGTSLIGGSSKLSGTFIGCLVIAIVNNILNLKGISTYWQMIVRGVIIVVAVVADYRIKGIGKKA